jgi:hypothetical protein
VALIIAGVGGWIALAQLRQQQKVIGRELRRGAELEEARLRDQAAAVDLAWSIKSGRETFVRVTNNSHRPIRDLDCRIVSDKDGELITLPEKAGEMQEKKLQNGSNWVLPDKGVALGEWCNVLRSRGHAGFLMPKPPGSSQRALLRFTDDAGLRWQLDNELHLERITGESSDMPTLPADRNSAFSMAESTSDNGSVPPSLRCSSSHQDQNQH